MKQLRFILLLVALSVGVSPLYSQELDAKIMFSINSAVVNKSFGDNAKTLEMLDNILLNNDENYKIQNIEVIASSSIDGNYSLNRNLAQKRINAVRSFLFKRYPNTPQSTFKFAVIGENWADLKACVIADSKVPYKKSVLSVINSNNSPDRKEALFKNIKNGVSWNYMKRNIFPKQRYGVGLVFVLKEEYREPEPIVEPTPEPEPIAEPEPVIEPEPTPEPEPEPIAEEVVEEVKDDKFLFALKTNMLADVLTALNFEVEVPIGNRYSVSGEFMFPWWRGVNNDFTVQILSAHFEGKYWFGERTKENRLKGFSAGVYTGFGTYDLQPFSSSGVSGNFFELGVIAGYSHTLHKNLNLEYELGLGYIHSGYREYDMAEVNNLGYVKVVRDNCIDSKIYKNTVLPARLKVSLVWMLEWPLF